jgi:hypothetical protein
MIMKQAKEAGIDVISTYVFWNVHEESPGIYDFTTGSKNISGFLLAAKEAGLFVNLRVGPFICAEWNYGGLPIWLRRVPSNYAQSGIVFRTADPAFMLRMRLFVERVVQEVRHHFAPNGNIVLAQIENEYGNAQSFGQYGEDGIRYAQWCANLATELVPSIPWIMCQQENVTGVLTTCNGKGGLVSFISGSPHHRPHAHPLLTPCSPPARPLLLPTRILLRRLCSCTNASIDERLASNVDGDVVRVDALVGGGETHPACRGCRVRGRSLRGQGRHTGELLHVVCQ